MVTPKPLFIFHRKHAIDAMTNSSIINSMAIEHIIPHELTSTGAWKMIPYKSHGMGRL